MFFTNIKNIFINFNQPLPLEHSHIPVVIWNLHVRCQNLISSLEAQLNLFAGYPSRTLNFDFDTCTQNILSGSAKKSDRIDLWRIQMEESLTGKAEVFFFVQHSH